MDYDEDQVLTQYIWDNFRYLMTDDEQLAGAVADERTRHTSSSSPRSVPKPLPASQRPVDAAVEAALAGGIEAFRHRVRERILRERADVAVVARCPTCEKIISHPDAQLCFWCGHDWHGERT